MSVYYRMRKWYDAWFVLARLSGSLVPRALLSAGLSLVLCYIYHSYAFNKDSDSYITNPLGVTIFMQAAAFLLAFTASICHGRFWEALGHVYQLSINLSGMASMLVALEEVLDMSSMTTCLHDISLLHAVFIQSLFTEDDPAPLDVVGGLSPWELSELSLETDQVALVTHWMHSDLFDLISTDKIPSSVVSSLLTSLNSAITSWSHARKISRVPLPITFQQFLAIADLMILFVIPLMVTIFTPNLYLALTLTFMIAVLYHGVYLSNISMQQPFGEKSTDLPLVKVHRDFTKRLLSFINKDIASELNRLTENLESRLGRAPRFGADIPKPEKETPIFLREQETPIPFREQEIIPVRDSFNKPREQSYETPGKVSQLQFSRGTVLGDKTLRESRPGSKRNSLIGGSTLIGGSFDNLDRQPEGIYFEGKILAQEFVLPAESANENNRNT